MAFLSLILEKNAGIKINFLCISLFYEFLMYFFVFWPFVFVVFFGEICGRHFLKHNNAKINSFQPLRVKISIYMWTMWKKINLHWFCTQNHILEPFSVRHACTKSYVTSEPYPGRHKFGVKMCGKLERKKSWKKSAKFCTVKKTTGGGHNGPPPQVS